MTISHIKITGEHWAKAVDQLPAYISNKALEIALAEANAFQAQPEPVEPYAALCAEYALKPVSWESMPKGVRIQYRTDLLTLRHVAGNKVWLEDLYETPGIDGHVYADVKLAPVDQQPWIAVQSNFEKVDGLVYKYRYGLLDPITTDETVIAYRVIGIAEGWKLK